MIITKLQEHEKGLHIHNYREFSLDILEKYDFYILGSVLCPHFMVHKDDDEIIQVCQNLRRLHGDRKIYIQQPFYLANQHDKFVDLIKKLRTMKLINGIIVNSIGLLRELDHEVEVILSRFSIRKRKRINKYVFNLVKNYNVVAFECFQHDHMLINDLKQLNQYKVWLRHVPENFYGFSPKCLIEQYIGKCTHEPSKCISGSYKLKNTFQNVDFILSGHFIYEGHGKKVDNDYNKYGDTIIYNEGEFEI